MRMLDKINYWAGSCNLGRRPWQFSIELGCRCLSKNAAYIRALEPLKPLVSLVRWQSHARIPGKKMADFTVAVQCRKCGSSGTKEFQRKSHKFFDLRCTLSA